MRGVWCDEAELDRLFRLRAERVFDRGGDLRYKRWRVYGERGLAGQRGAVWLFGEVLTVAYEDEPLAQYRVAYASATRRIAALTDPRLFATRHPSPQPFLGDLDGVEWHPALRLDGSMLIGYARVSTGEQTLDLQLDALQKAGCEKTYQETASGAAAERPVLAEVVGYLRPGDTLVVWRLDRLGRSLQHLIETIAALAARGIGFKSLTEQIDTTTSGGKLVFHVFGALAEFERDLIQERTQAGLAAARARGRTGGRPKALADPKQVAMAQALYDGGQADVATICETLGISRATLYRALKPRPHENTTSS